MSSYNCHLKVIKDMKRSDAYDPALCGREDPGTLFYSSFNPADEADVERTRQRAEQGSMEKVSICPGCCEAFLSQYSDPSAVGRLAPVCVKGVQP